MVSGTPVLTARLEGIPKEYESYLFYFNDKEEKGLDIALRNILDRKPNELEEFGEKTRKFVLNNKNNIIQTKRVIDFIENQ